jgi:hypothetical protein
VVVRRGGVRVSFAKPYVVLVCGSRGWTDETAIHRELEKLAPGSRVIHGGARGADSIAGELARERGLEVVVYPADWHAHGKGAGPIRNQQMLDEGRPDFVWAFTLGTPGTADMLRRSYAALARGEVSAVVEFRPRGRMRLPSVIWDFGEEACA